MDIKGHIYTVLYMEPGGGYMCTPGALAVRVRAEYSCARAVMHDLHMCVK